MDRRRTRTEAGALRLPIGVATAVGLGLVAPAAQADDFTVQNTADAGTDSLRDVIGATNSNPGADRILFKSGLSGEITLESDLPQIEGPVEIAGPGPDQLAIDGATDHRPFFLKADATISGLTVKNARSFKQCTEPDASGYSCNADDGGAIRGTVDADVVIDDMAFRDNAAEITSGGAISTLGDLTISNSVFEGNTAGQEGGAVQASADFNAAPGDLKITNSVFEGNEAENAGGGAVAKNSWHATRSVSISDSTFTGNGSAGEGGALEVQNYGPATVTDSTFSGNTAGGSGGGVFLTFWGGTGTISGSLFDTNEARRGGGLAVDSVIREVSLDNSTFFGNGSSEEGGAVLVREASIDIDSITATGNEAGDGALFAEFGESTLQNSIVSGNTGGDLSGNPYYRGPDAPIPGTDWVPIIEPAGTWKTSFSFIGETNGTAFVDDQPGSNIVGNSSPQLGALADNGGPTQTMLPAAASPAVDQGSTDLLADQRGRVRPAGPEDDMGAVELQDSEGIQPVHGGPPVPIRFGKVTLNKKKGYAMLPVKVPAAGTLKLVRSKALVRRKATVKAAGTIRLKIRARGKTAKALMKRGKAMVRVRVSFVAATGALMTRGTSVKLVKKKPEKKKK